MYLEDMLEAVRRALSYTSGMSRTAFFADRRTVDAVVGNLGVLGEATKHVPEEIRVRHRGVAWKRVSGRARKLSYCPRAHVSQGSFVA
jgi:uncharacterized protein with HEPN domain